MDESMSSHPTSRGPASGLHLDFLELDTHQ